jgi:hypothetical protein
MKCYLSLKGNGNDLRTKLAMSQKDYLAIIEKKIQGDTR